MREHEAVREIILRENTLKVSESEYKVILSLVAVLRAQIPLLTFARSALGLNPYLWQARVLCAIENKFPVALATCNGAGKTSIILGSAVLWFLWHFPRGRCVITSGSWTQLTEQLFMGLREFSTKPLFRGWSFLDSEIRTPQAWVRDRA